MKMLAKRIIPDTWRSLIRRVLFSEKRFLLAAHFRQLTGQPLLFRDADQLLFVCQTPARYARYSQNRTVLNERSTLKYIASVLRSGNVVVDVGANIGGIALYCGRLVKPEGRVFAFEAEEQNYAALAQSIQLNGMESLVTANHAAVFSEDGIVTLNVFNTEQPEWHTLGWFELAGHQPSKTQIVKAVRLDTFFEQTGLTHIDLLKVDVEGAEPNVFAGAQTLLRKQQIDRIVFEISKIPMEGMGYSISDVFQPLRAAGYRLYLIGDSGVSSVETDELHDVSYANFVAVSPRLST